MLQEVFLSFLERDLRILRGYRGEGTVTGYLAAVAVCRVLDGRAAETGGTALSREVADPSQGPLEALEGREAREALQRALERLPLRNRLALLLQGDGASLREIGRALGVSEEAAAQLVSRARSELRGRLKE